MRSPEACPRCQDTKEILSFRIKGHTYEIANTKNNYEFYEPYLGGGSVSICPDCEPSDPYLPLRSAIAHLSANELSRFSTHLSNYIVTPDGFNPDHVAGWIDEALSYFATTGFKENT